jgi:hypothetical protein
MERLGRTRGLSEYTNLLNSYPRRKTPNHETTPQEVAGKQSIKLGEKMSRQSGSTLHPELANY